MDLWGARSCRENHPHLSRIWVISYRNDLVTQFSTCNFVLTYSGKGTREHQSPKLLITSIRMTTKRIGRSHSSGPRLCSSLYHSFQEGPPPHALQTSTLFLNWPVISGTCLVLNVFLALKSQKAYLRRRNLAADSQACVGKPQFNC